MQRPPLPTPNRNRVRPQQTPTSSHQRGVVRFSTPKASPRRSPATHSVQSNNGALWESYATDENSLTVRFLYSNLLLLGIECSSVFARYRAGQQQISLDELSNSTELIRLVTHFLLLTYLTDSQQAQYVRDTTHCFPPVAIDKQQEFNRIVKQHLKTLVRTAVERVDMTLDCACRCLVGHIRTISVATTNSCSVVFASLLHLSILPIAIVFDTSSRTVGDARTISRHGQLRQSRSNQRSSQTADSFR
jgi:hypothetical protein